MKGHIRERSAGHWARERRNDGKAVAQVAQLRRHETGGPERMRANREVLNRLWESFDMRPRRTLEELVVHYQSLLARLEHWERITRSDRIIGENK